MRTKSKPPAELESWRSIAEYLGISIRTAQKWTAERGLPVTGQVKGRGTVTASPAQLDCWRKATLEKPVIWDNLPLLRVYAAITAGVLLLQLGVVFGLHILGSRRGPPARFVQDYNSLIVTDEQGRECWRRQFEDPFRTQEDQEGLPAAQRVSFVDVDGDRHVETLFVYEPATLDEKGSTLICYSDRGDEKWRFQPGRTVRTASSVFSPPYAISYAGALPSQDPRDDRILVVSHHLTQYPAQVAILSAAGRLRGEYWHSGPLYSVQTADLDGDGAPEILLGGLSRAYEAATLLVLDSREVRGASSETEAPEYQILGFGPGSERTRILFPRTRVNRRLEAYNFLDEIMLRPDSVQLSVRERVSEDAGRANPGLIYTLNRRLEFLTVEANDLFWSLHRQLQSTGRLDHALTDEEVRKMLKGIRVLKDARAGNR
jgi:hypothetical protein